MNENTPPSHTENYDFQHGYHSGLESVDKNTYEGYLSSQVNFEWLSRQLVEKRLELTDLEKVIDHVKVRFKEAYDALQDRLLKVNLAGKNKDRIESQVAENESFIQQFTEKRIAAGHKYSLFAGFIYFFAGISFVAGDLIISHEIRFFSYSLSDKSALAVVNCQSSSPT